MSEIKLKPCPFCGSNEVYVFSGNNYIVCTTCKAKFQKAKFQTDKYLTGEQLSEAWNMRAERHGYWKQATPFVDTIECSECGYQWPEPAMASKYCPDCGALMLMDEEVNV